MNVGLPGQRKPESTSGIKGYRLFRIFGFDVKLNLTWLLLALLITWSLGAGLFPIDYPGLSQHTYWWMGVAGAIGILFSIVFHELSHALVGRRLGVTVKGITLFIFGGVAEMKEEPVSPKVEFLMAVAGPLASLLLAFLFSRVEVLATARGWPTPFIGVSHYLALVNLVLAVFNLLPGFPLDGGRMLRAALWYGKGDLRYATYIASRIGAGFGIGFMVLGGLAFIQGNVIGGMWWLLIGAFLRTAANTSYRQMLVSEILGDKPVRQFMQDRPVSVPPNLSVQQWLDDYVYHYHFKMFPVQDDGRLLGCVRTSDIKAIPRDRWTDATLGELVTPPSDANSVSPDTTASKLISRMTQSGGNTRFMVVKDGQLVGVVSLKDLGEYIALKLEIESPGP